MEPAAILRVIVEAQRVDHTVRKITGLDRQMEAAAATADRMDREVTDLDSALQKAQKATAGAASATKGLDTDLKRATQSSRAQQDATAKLAQALGGLTDDADDFTDKLTAARGVQVESAAATKRLDHQTRALGATFGGMAGDVDDMATELQRMNTLHQRTTVAAQESERAHGRLGAGWARVASAGRSLGDRLRAVGAGGDDGGRGIRRFMDTMGDLPGRIYLSTRLLGALGNALLLIAPVALAAGAGLFAIGSALAPIVGLAAGAAGGLLALAQGAGVLKLATMGIGDALSEQIKAQDKAGETAIRAAGQQRSAAQAVASAQEAVRNAQDRVGDATRRLSDAERTAKQATDALSDARGQARQRLEDLRSSLVNAALSEQRATLALRDAREHLKAVTTIDPTAVKAAHQAAADAAYGEEDAVRALERARADYAKLIGGADPRTLADAQEAVSDAVRNEQRATLRLDQIRTRSQETLASATATDEEKREAALDLADAEDAVGDAVQRRLDAEKDLAGIQAGPSDEEKAEGRRRVAEAERDVERAKRATATAEKRIRDAEKGASSQEIADARLAVAEAEDRAADAKREHAHMAADLAQAERKGIRGADAVVAARERIRDATRDVADAQRDLRDAQRDAVKAQQAVRDAQISARDSAAALAIAAQDVKEKFNDLPPAAQAFVRALVALKPRMDELRATAAAGLLPGVQAGIEAAMGSFEPFQRVVGRTAETMGGLAQKAGELVGSKGFGRDLETIGNRNAKVLGAFGRAGIHLVDAFRHLTVAAGPLTSWMGRVVERWGEGAAKAAAAGRKTGELADFFDKAKNRAKLFGSIIGNLVGGIFGMGKASEKSGVRMLRDFDGLTERFSEWANSVKGRNAVADFMDKVRAAMREIGPALGAVIKGFGEFATKILPAYAKALNVLGPYLDEFVAAVIALKVAATVAGAVSSLGKALLFLAANPVVLAVAAIAAVAAGLVYAYKNSEKFREFVDKAVASVKAFADGLGGDLSDDLETAKKALENLWTAVKPVLGVFRDIAERALPGIKRHLEGFVQTVRGVVQVVTGLLAGDFSKAWEGVKNIVGGVIDGVIGAIQAWSAPIREVASKVGGWLLDGIKALPGLLLDAGVWLVEQIVAGFKSLGSLVKEAGEWLLGQLKKFVESSIAGYKAIGEWVLEKVKDGFTAFPGLVKAMAIWLKDRAIEFVEAQIRGWKRIGEWVLERLIDGFKSLAVVVKDAVGWLKDRVVDFVKDRVENFKDLGSWLLNRIIDGFKTVTELLGTVGTWLKNRVVDFVQGAKDGFVGLGSWVVNRVADGFTTVTDALGGVGEWLMDKVTGIVKKARDGFKDIGGWIIDRIVDGLRGGANLIIGFVNKIIGAVNKLPFLDIGEIPLFDTGAKPRAAASSAAQFLAQGGKVTRPMAIVGEEAPRHPEYVIPTNPAYRGRAVGLFGSLGKELGVPGFAQGGVIGGLNRTFPKHSLQEAPGHTQLSEKQVAALAYGAGFRGNTVLRMVEIAKGESTFYPGVVSWDGGWGLWQHTPRTWGAEGHAQLAKLGGIGQMLNPVKNAVMAKYLYDESGLAPWYGTKFLGTMGTVDTKGGIKDWIGNAAADAATFAAGNLPGLGAAVDVAQLFAKVKSAMPDPGSLPGWIKGDWLVGKALSWAKQQIESRVPLGGGGGAVPGYSGPPPDFKQLGDNAWVDSHTAAVAHYLAQKFGSTISDGWRPQNAGYGATNSSHKRGTPSNPGAFDFVPPSPAMQAFAAKHIAGLNENDIHDWGTGLHNHIAFFRKGGIMARGLGSLPYAGSFAGGGVVPGPIGSPRAAVVHGGEVITDPRVDPSGPMIGEVHIHGSNVSEEQIASTLAWKLQGMGLTA